MQTSTVGSILEAISVLEPDDQLFVTEVLKKRAIEIKKAERLGREAGLKEGREDGLREGIEQGIEQGELRAKLAIAQHLLNVLDDESISRTSGLSLEAIAQLRNQ